jgi:hypothetical protein
MGQAGSGGLSPRKNREIITLIDGFVLTAILLLPYLILMWLCRIG